MAAGKADQAAAETGAPAGPLPAAICGWLSLALGAVALPVIPALITWAFHHWTVYQMDRLRDRALEPYSVVGRLFLVHVFGCALSIAGMVRHERPKALSVIACITNVAGMVTVAADTLVVEWEYVGGGKDSLDLFVLFVLTPLVLVCLTVLLIMARARRRRQSIGLRESS